jgi:hypothetical protein
MELRIVWLAERPELAGAIGRWHWAQWGRDEDPEGSLESWTARLAAWASPNQAAPQEVRSRGRSRAPVAPRSTVDSWPTTSPVSR